MPYSKCTKIIATIGPSSDSTEKIKLLISHGVNIFRFNLKHNTFDWHLEKIKKVQKIADELGVTVGILVDLQGPEVRVETFNSQDVVLDKNEEVIFYPSFELSKKDSEAISSLTDNKIVKIAKEKVFGGFDIDDEFSIEDGFHEFKITKKLDKGFIAKINESGVVKDRKGLNFFGKDLDLPSIVEDDLDKLDMSCKQKMDYVALSFTRDKKDIEGLRKELNKRGIDVHIVAKIESKSGLDNLDEILGVTDAVMIARGDLGIEIPFEKITYYQKEIIKKCRDSAKPVIVATQMLESMISNPRPTRAEAADVANAIFDETDAIMLSGETATGKYPVKAVESMKKIALFNEQHKVMAGYVPKIQDQTRSIVNAAMGIVSDSSPVKINKIVVFTETGYTAKILSSFRPKSHVIALSENLGTVDKLTMSYGVIPLYMKFPKGDFSYPDRANNLLKKRGFLKDGDTILVVHGKKWQDPGYTNSLVVLTV
jgi:pyruvate kinase